MTVLGSTDLGDNLSSLNVDHDPTVVATDARTGSIIIFGSTHYVKLDDGLTTNVTPLAGSSSDVLTGNVVWVDSVNGNDGTGIRGRLSKPFLTIQAAINAAVAGDTVFVLPGTYVEQIVCKDDVSVLGIDRRRCVLSYSGALSVTIITMARRHLVTNFDLQLNPTAGVTTGILFPGLTNADSAIVRVNINANVTGDVTGASITGTAISTGTRAAIRECNMVGSGSGYGLHVNHGTGTGHTRFDASLFNSSVGARVEAGIAHFDKCTITGTIGLQTVAGTTTFLESNTTISAYDCSGTLTLNSFTFPRNNYNAIVDPTANDDSSDGYSQGSEWNNISTRAGWVCVSSVIGAADWDLILSPETSEQIPFPESRAGGNATRVAQTSYEGASFRVAKHMDAVNRLIVQVTAGTFTPIPTISIVIYQEKYGGSGVADRIAYFNFQPTATGVYTITPVNAIYNIQSGIIYVLFGRVSGTGGTATMRTYTTSTNDLINVNVPSGVHPATFTTAIAAATTPPSTFDPRATVGSAIESGLDVILNHRLLKV